MEEQENIDLYYRDGSSDKIYRVNLYQAVGGWTVTFAYGRRGSSLTNGQKCADTDFITAKKVYDKLVREKEAKGYKATSGTKTAVVSSIPAQEDTGIRCQLLNEIEEKDLEKYITDDNWCAQEKWDGRRRLLLKIGNKARATNRKGLVIPVEPNIEADLLKLEVPSIILDGEAFDDYVMVFDTLGSDLPYKKRYKQMADILDMEGVTTLIPVTTAWNTYEKSKLLGELRRANAEGIVFKNINSKYKSGRPNSGGDMLKFKFVTTASCVVRNVNKTKRSIAVAVYDEANQLLDIGNVTVYPNQDIPPIGSIVEVRYLYYFEGGSLFQPVLQGTGDCTRDDIDSKDCVLSQLKLKRQEVTNE